MFFNRRKEKNLNAIYQMHSIDSSAFSLVGVFIPIYFLTQGYSLTEVFVYFIIQNTVLLISSFIAGFLGSKYGIHKTLIIRLPFLFLFLFLLMTIKVINFPIYLLAVIDGFQSALYWIPLHMVFTKSTDKKKIGNDLGKLFALPQIVTLFTPVIGGLIAVYFNFYVLFVITIIIFCFSIIPLLKINKIDIDFKFKIKDGIKLYKTNKVFFKTEVFNNIGEEIGGIIWPIFIYLNLYNIAAVGFAATLVSVGSFILTLFMGKLSDKVSKIKLIKIGAALIIITWFLKYQYNSEFAFYVLALISGFVFVIFQVPYYAKLLSVPKKSKADEFIIFREIPVNLARIIVFSLAIVFVANLEILFPIAGLAYIYFLVKEF